MLEYEWGNPSTMMLTGNEGGATTEPDQTHRQMFDHNYTFLPEPNQFHGPTLTSTTDFSHYHHFNFNPPHPQQNHPLFYPRAFPSASSTSFSTPPPSMLSLNPFPPVRPGPGLMPVPKPEHVGRPMDFAGSAGLGLNLGGRTYFLSSSSEDDFVSRLYRRPNLVEPGSTASSLMPNSSARCQAQGCNIDLSDAKHYHRRHKVCEFHSKAATVIAAGLTQRFCQQCSRFHLLSEFDNGKRSCRKRLADHNRRRRKTQQLNQENRNYQPTLDDVARSPPESESQPSSSVKVAASPPDYFQQRPDQSAGTSISNHCFSQVGTCMHMKAICICMTNNLVINE